MSDLTQKVCPECGERAIKIAKDKAGKRTCACGNEWYPSQKKENE